MSELVYLYSKRNLLLNSIRVELKNQYAGTSLGLLWIVIGPILLLVLYGIIYALIFNVRVPNYTQAEYILNVFSGLVLFLGFSQALALCSSVLNQQKKLIYSSYPPVFIPIKAVLVAYMIIVPSTIFVLLADFTFSEVSYHLILLIPVAIFQILLSIGIGFYISLLGLVWKDITFLVQYILIALLVVTPIAYTPEMIPDRLKLLLYVNPLYYFVSANQHFVLLNEYPPLFEMLIGLFSAIFLFVSGLWFFMRAQKVIVDLL